MTYDELFRHTKKLKVLYVEDEPLVREATLSFLENYFTSIEVCRDGQAGFRKYEQNLDTDSSYDIVLTDIRMPILSGVEMAKAIKQINEEQIIVFITAQKDKDFFLKATTLEVDYCLFKPLELDEFIKVIEDIIKLDN